SQHAIGPSQPPISAFHIPISLRRYLVGVGCWSIVTIVATEIWYRAHSLKEAGIFHWSASLPESQPGFKKIELPEHAIKMLAYDQGSSGQWTDGSVEWSAHFFRWQPRSIQHVISSRVHRPDVCLPAAGLRQISDSGVTYFPAGHLQ